MIVIFKASAKIYTVSLITERLWIESSFWWTARSGLKGWSLSRKCGFRLVNPLFGCSAIFSKSGAR